MCGNSALITVQYAYYWYFVHLTWCIQCI